MSEDERQPIGDGQHEITHDGADDKAENKPWHGRGNKPVERVLKFTGGYQGEQANPPHKEPSNEEATAEEWYKAFRKDSNPQAK